MLVILFILLSMQAHFFGYQTEHIKRTHDYEPFLNGFVRALHQEGLLNPLLNLDENGRKVRKSKMNGS
jgi:hypothetical protein